MDHLMDVLVDHGASAALAIAVPFVVHVAALATYLVPLATDLGLAGPVVLVELPSDVQRLGSKLQVYALYLEQV